MKIYVLRKIRGVLREKVLPEFYFENEHLNKFDDGGSSDGSMKLTN